MQITIDAEFTWRKLIRMRLKAFNSFQKSLISNKCTYFAHFGSCTIYMNQNMEMNMRSLTCHQLFSFHSVQRQNLHSVSRGKKKTPFTIVLKSMNYPEQMVICSFLIFKFSNKTHEGVGWVGMLRSQPRFYTNIDLNSKANDVFFQPYVISKRMS